MFAQIVDVFKIRIGLLMAITTVAGFVVTPGRELSVGEIAFLAFLVFIASACAGAFNQYVEREVDAKMSRTSKRPFVTGYFSAKKHWLWGVSILLLLSVAIASWYFNASVAAYVFLGAFFYAVVYTLWLKPRTVWNIVIGGAAGSFAVLAGAAAANPHLSIESMLLAVILFLWTPPHFWSLAIVLHKDYAQANIPMLPVEVGDQRAAKIILVNTLLLSVISILPFFFGLGWIYLLGAVTGSGYFILKSIQLVNSPEPSTAIRCFLASLVQLTLVLIAAIVDVKLNI